jgi:hypothetical protein
MRTKIIAAAVVAAVGCGGTPLACAQAVGGTTVGGTLFFDLSYIRLQNEDATGSKVDAPPTGFGFDVKRFYLIVNHRFDDTWAANITTDAQYSSSASVNTSVIIKKLYIEGAFSPSFVLHVGAYDNPWVPFVDGQYGYRYIEKSITDRLGFANSADWGINANGELGDGTVSYSASMLNGGGYKNPTRTKHVDFEGRVGAQPIDWLLVAAGFYTGHLGQINATNQDYPSNTATRWDALIAVNVSGLRVGVEYFDAKNYETVDDVATSAFGTSAVVASSPTGTVPSDRAEGVSVWASFSCNPQWSVFARYDDVKLSKDVAPNLKDQYANAGVAYEPVRPLDVALVYKYEKVSNGSTSVSAGNANNSYKIGGANGMTSGTFNEFGVYVQYKF